MSEIHQEESECRHVESLIGRRVHEHDSMSGRSSDKASNDPADEIIRWNNTTQQVNQNVFMIRKIRRRCFAIFVSVRGSLLMTLSFLIDRVFINIYKVSRITLCAKRNVLKGW
jgi:hypothetical protein